MIFKMRMIIFILLTQKDYCFCSYTTFIKKTHLNSLNKQFLGNLFPAEGFIDENDINQAIFKNFNKYFFFLYFIYIVHFNIFCRFCLTFTKENLTSVIDVQQKIMQIYKNILNLFFLTRFCKNLTFKTLYIKLNTGTLSSIMSK